jgi:nucleoside-diphosphate-sugar epimerase
MLAILEKKIGKKAKIEYIDRHKADITASLADVNKAKRILGWNPQVNLDQGISNMVQWFIEEKDWIKQVKLP